MSIGFPTFTPTVHRDSSGACPWPQSSTYIRSTPFPFDWARTVLLRKSTATAATIMLTFFMGRPPTFNAKRVLVAQTLVCALFACARPKPKPHRLKPVLLDCAGRKSCKHCGLTLLVRPSWTVRVTTVAITGHMFRQPFSGNLDPHSRGVTNGPAIFAVRLGLVAAPDQFGFYRGLIVIFNRRREVSDIRLMFGVLTLPEVQGVFAKLEETYRASRSIHSEQVARLVVNQLHSKQVGIKLAALIDIGNHQD